MEAKTKENRKRAQESPTKEIKSPSKTRDESKDPIAKTSSIKQTALRANTSSTPGEVGARSQSSASNVSSAVRKLPFVSSESVEAEEVTSKPAKSRADSINLVDLQPGKRKQAPGSNLQLSSIAIQPKKIRLLTPVNSSKTNANFGSPSFLRKEKHGKVNQDQGAYERMKLMLSDNKQKLNDEDDENSLFLPKREGYKKASLEKLMARERENKAEIELLEKRIKGLAVHMARVSALRDEACTHLKPDVWSASFMKVSTMLRTEIRFLNGIHNDASHIDDEEDVHDSIEE
jgi:hypothetical protein